ncbi:MAG: nucleoside kinase [Prevotella sp.]|nr:nucleoside kinase [Prevotella sp.]
MMTIEIRCKNNDSVRKFDIGITLSEIFFQLDLRMPLPPVAAMVNNEVVSLSYRIFGNKTVEFIDVTTLAGMRIYTRTLFFILCKAVHDTFPQGKVDIEFPVSNGYYCNLRIGRPVTDEDADRLKERMNNIIASSIPIKRHQRPTEEVIEMFRKTGDTSKEMLLESLGSLYTVYCSIDGYNDYFYGPTLCNTQEVSLFGLEKYYDGLLLRVPRRDNPTELGEMIRQDKMFEVFNEYHQWQDTMGINTVGELNKAIMKGFSSELILVFEALQEKRLSHIADTIAQRKGVKVVLIAGPSSSGKTTTCKRLSIQLLTNGIRPVGISLDDYFVNREETPKDENGEYDFESLYALNLPLFNQQLIALINGEEVELPRYNFMTGRSEASGKRLRLRDNDILVIEGIHALNPELTAQLPQEQIFRIYASALTTITIDNHNYIPTTDNRLLRRIIRDSKYRNCPAQTTLHRWTSVRAGEDKWIFPFQENADAVFNTAMLFELSVIKNQAEAALEQVPENCPEYAEASRLLNFLHYIKPISESQVPPTSLLCEFLGGSTFVY